MIAKFQGRSLKIEPRSSFDLNGLKNSTRKYFENSLKLFQIFQILMGGKNFRERSKKKPKRPPQWVVTVKSYLLVITSILDVTKTIATDTKTWWPSTIKTWMKRLETILSDLEGPQPQVIYNPNMAMGF